ncbi:DNA alkylation repair protein [Candidatus Dependentiae bacterium]|nr:DNA alkylation repair protein [Candidatus Dependentiae bacterium]
MDTLQHIQDLVRHSSDPARAHKAQYFKTGPGHYAEHDRFLGVPNPVLRQIAKTSKILPLPVIEELLKSPYNEERLLALFFLVNSYTKASETERTELYHFYLAHTGQINNWNLVDASAHLIVGHYLYAKEKESLIILARSSSLWERRIAIVATWYFIRKGDLQWTFLLSEVLLTDTHDLIHKAVGWMLREAGKRDQQKLRAFLQERAHCMPRTMLSYALEKFSPEEQRAFRKLKLSSNTKGTHE